jgi:tRNA uridine 5-carboxymethylaminomethyl modification enzyme
MFTSRAEYRTLLRQDNADIRLSPLSHSLGLAREERMEKVKAKEAAVLSIRKILNEISIEPVEVNTFLESIHSAPLAQKQKLSQLVLRPGIGIREIMTAVPSVSRHLASYTPEQLEQSEIQVKYDVYIEKEKELVARMAQMEDLQIPNDFDYARVQAISAEAREKLKKIQPITLGQASRISGINPSDVQILMVYMGR